jgi:hypothetical protein
LGDGSTVTAASGGTVVVVVTVVVVCVVDAGVCAGAGVRLARGSGATGISATGGTGGGSDAAHTADTETSDRATPSAAGRDQRRDAMGPPLCLLSPPGQILGE